MRNHPTYCPRQTIYTKLVAGTSSPLLYSDGIFGRVLPLREDVPQAFYVATTGHPRPEVDRQGEHTARQRGAIAQRIAVDALLGVAVLSATDPYESY